MVKGWGQFVEGEDLALTFTSSISFSSFFKVPSNLTNFALFTLANFIWIFEPFI